MKSLLSQNEIHSSDLDLLLKERENKSLDFILIDVREEYEYNIEHIVGVDYLIPMSNLYRLVDTIMQHKKDFIILQCKSGGRSLQVQRHLIKMGFEKTINLNGGISSFQGKTQKQ